MAKRAAKKASVKKASVISFAPKSESAQSARTLSVLMHVLSIFIGFLSPLIFLLASEDKTVKNNSRNALNWQISLIIYMIVSVILILILIGALLVPLLMLLNVIFCIIAAVKASDGELWEYPLAIKFFK